MKRITSFKTLLSMLAMVVMGSTVAVAENKVYISDFSIAAGDETEIAINFDTDATDIRGIEGTITLPAGLTAGDNATKAENTRIDGMLNQFNRITGLFKIRGIASVITGTTGAVAYLKVKADASLAATSIIKLSSFTIEHSDGTKEDATTANATVTCTSATPSVNTLAVEPAEIGLFAGGTAEFTVSLNNEDAINGFNAVLELPAGVTATLEKSDRLTGFVFQYNAATGIIMYLGTSSLAGNDGAIFTVKLTADDTFTAPAKVTLSMELTNSAAKSFDVDPVVINIVAADPFAELVKKAIDGAAGGVATITLDQDYAAKSSIVLPAGMSVVLDGAGFTLDASELGSNLIQMDATAPADWTKADVTISNLTVKGLKKALFYSAAQKYVAENFIIDNCIVEQAADATTIDYTKGGTAVNFTVTNSTFYAPTATTKSFYSSQLGQKTTDYSADAIQTFTFKNNTMYNLAKNKNFFSHRQSNQKWLSYDVENNIFVNCGKSGQVIKGMNGGSSGKNPTWKIENNAFNYDGADTSASEDTGDSEEPVNNSIAEVVTFADAANGDFTVGESSIVAREKAGDPRWLVDFVAPTVNTNGLLLEINKATKVVDDANAEEAPEALKALKDELEKAETIFANPVGKVQSEIDAETAALKAAREAYPKAVAKEALDKEIAAANDLLGETATDADPGKALNDAITAAKAVSTNADATVDELKAATEALKAAEEAYNKAVAKEALDKEIAAANDLLGETATDADPGKALKEAIEAAQTVAAKADATADDLNAATEALKAAEEAFNTATGIESVKVDDLTKDGAVYNLNGVRVTNPTKGLYIKNGKKYMVK